MMRPDQVLAIMGGKPNNMKDFTLFTVASTGAIDWFPLGYIDLPGFSYYPAAIYGYPQALNLPSKVNYPGSA